MRSVYVKDVGQCLVSKDVYEAIGYDKEDGAKVIQRLFPEKYKNRFGNAQVDLECVDNSVHTQPNMLLLRKTGLYCFLLRRKKPEAELFMECVVETVLPREVRKLTSVIEEKGTAVTLLTDDLQRWDNRIQAIQSENLVLQAPGDVYQAELQRSQDTIIHLRAY